MNIKGKKVTLRAIEEGDLTLLHKWANDPVTQDGIGETYPPSSMDFHRAWFLSLKGNPLNLRFVVEVPGPGISEEESIPVAIGLSSIVDIDWCNRHATHGLTIGDSNCRGKGYGVDAIMATMRYAFDEMGLERLNGGMIEYNAASEAIYQGKLNWKEEGRRRNYFYRKGRYWSWVMTGITRQDYQELLARTNYWEVP